MAEFFIQNEQNGIPNCADQSPYGIPSSRFDYILKSLTGDDDYPYDACTPYLHYNVRVANLRADAQILAPNYRGGNFYGTFYGTLNGRATGNKSFDISHPTKNDWRLRHVCLEGPESAVFFRGRLTNSNVIDLPE